ncbi:phospholipid/cholesterol/gamma-HCH transport system substrate-binding protein [Algoriphagus aquaeductus]|uniref:Phospholipid/cholesterol/gamma-HCH transport system substrate-binding protein n=1 Tax=Algoriphagus aquaeductus TaxID=475299 RepID=A0A326RMG8_9BACT|nr:MlaD family protein [Algoriphagus aquaeductus]PZV80237.1 phospholipid/cholesterol/gamma-HCH transport system substrate-binding protein [Algoriphagus aquaeductus]
MKDDKKIANTKLGAMVMAGLIFLVFSLYMIGKNQNIFGSSLIVIAEVTEVNGLLPGNNVRFKGMDIGTVKDIEMWNDSTIHVRMLIHKSMVPYIQKNALTTINSDGLMGNKIIQIHPQEGTSSPIEKGDILYSLPQMNAEALMGKLETSGEYLEKTLANLAEITEKLNQSEAFWNLLSDPTLSSEIKSSVVEFRNAGANASQLAKEGRDMIRTLREGDGMVNKLFTDTVSAARLDNSLRQLEQAGADAALVMKSVREVLAQVESGQGTAGMILSDSVFKAQMQRTMQNVESSTYNFNQNMEALKRNFLFRKYFKKQEKEK